MSQSNYKYKRQNIIFAIIAILSIFPFSLAAQKQESTESVQSLTLDECVEIALRNNPQIQNAILNEEYVETTIKSKLSDWYPQIGLTANYQHNFLLQTSNFNGNIINLGTKNTSGVLFGAKQTIFNPDVLLASKSADDVRKSVTQKTKEQKIDLVVAVSKAYYNTILMEQQKNVVEEDIKRNTLSAKDAFYQYESGIVDRTDYKRATISLNNSKARKVFTEESLKANKVYLKELMGFPETKKIALNLDTTALEQHIQLDTTLIINYEKRIEFQQLETQRKLQEDNLSYYKWSFLPELNLFGNYNLNYLNNQFSELYNISYPNSFVGLSLSFPIFEGGKRFHQIKGAELLIEQVDNDIKNLENMINSQYEAALAEYKGNLNNFMVLKENLTLATEVYDIIKLQYRSGVKTFLDVITAESDLNTAQINYYNALYQVLSSKIDVEQSLGNINY